MKQRTLLITVLVLCTYVMNAQDSSIEPYAGTLEKPLSTLIEVTPSDSSSLESLNGLPFTEISPEEGIESVDIGIITPMTRLELPSDEDEPMIRMMDCNGEYHIRRNPASDKNAELEENKRYKAKLERLKAKGVIFS